MEQATYQRGQVSTKVRYSPVQLVLDVPDGELLPAWAADPHKKQEVSVVFLDANGGQPIETLHLSGAYCIRYHEQFIHGDAAGGSYQCTLTLSDPTGWTIAPGGPAAAFVAPAARNHGIGGGAVAAVANAVGIGGAMAPAASAVSAVGIGGAMGTSANDRENDIEKLFKNPDLSEIRNKILAGTIARKFNDFISVEEQAVIAYYTTYEGYKDFNLALRGLGTMTEFFRAQERVTNEALEKLPKFKRTTFRGTGESEIQRFADAQIGDVIEYENFASSSLEEWVADDFMERKKGDYILVITSKSGVAIYDISMCPTEAEVMFKSKKKFKVTRKSYRARFDKDDPFIKEIYLEEV